MNDCMRVRALPFTFCLVGNLFYLCHTDQADSLSKWNEWLHEGEGFTVSLLSEWGAGIVQWLQCRTHDWKVVGLNPCWSSERTFFPRVSFLCGLLYWYPFHPRVSTVAHKRSQSFCQKCRWQVTTKHTHLTYVALHLTWCMVVWCTQNMPRWQQFHVAPATPAL